MTQTIFNIAKQVQPEAGRPYLIVETVFTSDGPRSRICDGRWETEEEALEILARKQSEAPR